MQEPVQQFDDCFEVELSVKKITDTLFLSSSHLLVLHIPNQYLLLQVVSRSDVKIIKRGTLPNLVENVKRMSNHCIAFIHENQLHVFNVFEEVSSQIYSIARSSIYSQQFHYEMFSVNGEQGFLFYKTSILKGVPLTIYYEVHSLLLKEEGFQKIKRLKIQHQDLRKFGFSCGQIFSYQLSGYEIEIAFVESGIVHKIQSIFSLFLISIKAQSEEVEFDFTHDELENELCTYRVNKKKVTKMDRKPINNEKHTISSNNNLRSLVFKNCYNRRKQDPCVGIFRVKAASESKLLHLMENSLPEETSNGFRQLILSLLLE